MKTVTVALYVLTALVTGLHNFYWLMDIVNGAPLNILNLTALLGSAALMTAAVTLPFRPRMAAKIASRVHHEFPGNANLLIGAPQIANREIGVPGFAALKSCA
jgi:hypothetical protein